MVMCQTRENVLNNSVQKTAHMRGLKPHLLISRTKLALHHDTDEHCFDAQKECSLYKAYSTRKDGNIDALQLAGRPTSRQSV